MIYWETDWSEAQTSNHSLLSLRINKPSHLALLQLMFRVKEYVFLPRFYTGGYALTTLISGWR